MRAAVEAAVPAVDVVGLFVSSMLSALVLAALVAGSFNYVNNRRNARITERKNNADEDNDLVARYQAMATEERSAKESAVRTVKDLLTMAEEQIKTLRGTIDQLSSTIETLQRSAESQQELIETVTLERDRLAEALRVSEERVSAQREQLLAKQAEILGSSAAPQSI
jgi:chromosome segregation ATPase